jgi:hypothetical protein
MCLSSPSRSAQSWDGLCPLITVDAWECPGRKKSKKSEKTRKKLHVFWKVCAIVHLGFIGLFLPSPLLLYLVLDIWPSMPTLSDLETGGEVLSLLSVDLRMGAVGRAYGPELYPIFSQLGYIFRRSLSFWLVFLT